MATIVADFVAQHGLVVSEAKRGYVQALWSGGNRPVFRVTWTFDNQHWYALSMDTLNATLYTAHSVTR